MSNQSQMVVATKYKLRTPLSIKDGTWKKDTGREKIHTKFIPRRVVENRNQQMNNELYIIDEDATEKYYEQREKNIIENAAKEKRALTSTADLVDAVHNMGKGTKDDDAEDEKVMHKLTKKDIENNPLLTENGLKAGDEVQLDTEGNVLFKS